MQIQRPKENSSGTKTTSQILNELIEALNQAEGAASGLIHACGQPMAFIQIRDTIALTKEGIVEVAMKNARMVVKGI